MVVFTGPEVDLSGLAGLGAREIGSVTAGEAKVRLPF